MKRHLFPLGVSWFAMQAIWMAYNSFMPPIYASLTANLTLVGIFMTFDNIIAVTLQPYWGAKSDLNQSPWGRRKPYLVIGFLLSALATFVLGFVLKIGLIPLLIVAILMNIAMAIFRSPLVSLFSDLFDSKTRSQVSGFTDMLAGVGAIVMLLVGGALYEVDRSLPFLMGAAFLLVAGIVVLVFLREPPADQALAHEPGDMPVQLIPAVRQLFLLKERSPLWFLLAIIFYWSAWNSLESFWTIYAEKALGLSVGDATQFAAILALSYIIAAIPAGFIAARFGRQKTMVWGLIIIIPLYLFGALNNNLILFGVLLAAIGALWALVMVNAPILFQSFASPRQIGLFSGIYLLGCALAQIVGPPTYGALMEAFGPQALWFTGFLSVLIAAFAMSRVREGRVLAPEGV